MVKEQKSPNSSKKSEQPYFLCEPGSCCQFPDGAHFNKWTHTHTHTNAAGLRNCGSRPNFGKDASKPTRGKVESPSSCEEFPVTSHCTALIIWSPDWLPSTLVYPPPHAYGREHIQCSKYTVTRHLEAELIIAAHLMTTLAGRVSSTRSKMPGHVWMTTHWFTTKQDCRILISDNRTVSSTKRRSSLSWLIKRFPVNWPGLCSLGALKN